MSKYLYSVVTAEPTSTIWPMSVVQTQSRFQYDELAIVRRFPAVKVVYKALDLRPTGDGSGDDDEQKADDDKEMSHGDDEEGGGNGASSLLKSGGLFSIFAVLFSMLIGAGLVMF
ncbi:hypothetical protein FCOIX_11807 [Fusarium coicis]|nr:hypothetical protein FCOIX_11807 [Fusarium coicis]